MSFNNLPEVDRFSMNEDESNNCFTRLFSFRNGFLPSKPVDKGCDFIVELIMGGKATNWWFPIQVKSVEKRTFVENGAFISYKFEVRQLGYLMEAVPSVSLILLYSLENKQLYFDFAENIYNRLLEKRDGNSNWKHQDNVHIHIPVSNVVDENSLPQIHGYIIDLHQNSSDRSPALYPQAPVIVSGFTTSGSDADSIGDPVKVLKTKGLDMYYNNEIPELGRLLDQTSVKALREDAHLSLLAGITYKVMGMHFDASFYIEKALKNEHISEGDLQHAEWIKLFLDNYLGRINIQDYNNKVKALLQQVPTEDTELRLIYQLCIARNDIDLLEPKNMTAYFYLIDNFRAFNMHISAADLGAAPTVRFYLENVTNHGILLIKCDSIFRWQILENRKKGKPIDAALYDEFRRLIISLTDDVEETFSTIKPLAHNFVHKIMLAQCFEAQVSIRLSLYLNALRYPLMKFDFGSDNFKQQLNNSYSFAQEAFEIFLNHQFYSSAYNMSLMLLELYEFSVHSIKLDMDEQKIRDQAEALRKKLGIEPFRIKAKELIQAHLPGTE